MLRKREIGTQPSMLPELEFVLRSLRAVERDNDVRIRDLIAQGLRWDDVLVFAHEHKLVQILQERCKTFEKSWLAPNENEKLMAFAHDLGKNNLAFLGEMLILHRLFSAAKIPAIPFKGPALAWLAYPNFSQRTCVDLDFVVPQRYIPDAMALLQANGYAPQFSLAEAQVGENRPAPGQYAFKPIGKGRFVELHTERTLRYFSRPINLVEMNSRLIELEIGGQMLRTFSVEDMLVMLCVHGAKHFWERLAWIVDIAQLVTRCEVNWTLLLAIAEKMQCTRLLQLGLFLAHEVIGASLPPEVLSRARADGNVQWLAGKVLEQYSGDAGPGFGVGSRALFRLRSCDRFGQGVRQLFKLSLSPTESDRETVELPGFLSALYSIVRPFRLIGKYGLGMRRVPSRDLGVYDPTPPEIVDRMLSLAEISSEDVLYDLGCGDGRIVVAAAKQYGIRAVGLDVDPQRIEDARANARSAGLEQRVEFRLCDAKNADLAAASVVVLYLHTEGMLLLGERLRSQLRRGARVVSRSAQIYGWTPDRTEIHNLANGARTELYRWTVTGSGRQIAGAEDPIPELRQTEKATDRIATRNSPGF